MAEPVLERTFIYQEEHELPDPVDVSHLVTEDDTPVDNIFSERQMDLLIDSLYASWSGPADGRPFLAMANVALYFTPRQQPLVPDALISLDVETPADVWKKENRSYFIWEFGKPPDVVVEIVSNRKGQETEYKLTQYARLGIGFYVVFDPNRQLSNKLLHIYTLKGTRYQESKKTWFAEVGVGVTLWQGTYRDMEATWLRWQDEKGNLLLTGEERAELAEEQAKLAKERAELAEERAERLAAQLRALGIEPE
ncbi:MAG TPA: Uma2 family endonuclease [Chloroflexota bacterium]|nr:Uma2 family endonuclease [Chloroflexota bacterium]